MTRIIDMLSEGRIASGDAKRMTALLFRAKHFTLDAEAYAFVCRLAGDEKLVEELSEFAIAPFDVITLSCDHITAMTDGAFTTSIDGQPVSSQHFTIWDHGDFKLLVARPDGSDLAILPGWTRVLPNNIIINQEAVLGVDDPKRVMGSLAIHRRMIQAFFLLLAQPSAYQVHFNEGRRALRRGRPVRYFGSSEIKINLSEPKQLRRLYHTGDRSGPRRHEVRRHFTHFGGDQGCTHQWEPLILDDDKHRWVCSCGRRRVERGPFGRGDANRGFVRQRYSITADPAD